MTRIGRKLVPSSTIQRRLQAQDDRVNARQAHTSDGRKAAERAIDTARRNTTGTWESLVSREGICIQCASRYTAETSCHCGANASLRGGI